MVTRFIRESIDRDQKWSNMSYTVLNLVFSYVEDRSDWSLNLVSHRWYDAFVNHSPEIWHDSDRALCVAYYTLRFRRIISDPELDRRFSITFGRIYPSDDGWLFSRSLEASCLRGRLMILHCARTIRNSRNLIQMLLYLKSHGSVHEFPKRYRFVIDLLESHERTGLLELDLMGNQEDAV